MSIYELLGQTVPRLAVSRMHQLPPGVSLRSHVRAMQDRLAQWNDESRKIDARWKEHVLDVAAKSVQTMRGNLLQFLTTPLQSDLQEIQRIIGDQVLHATDQLVPKARMGLIGSRISRLAGEVQLPQPLSRLAARSRSHLKQAGFKLGKAQPDILVQELLLEGGMSLDIFDLLENGLLPPLTEEKNQPMPLIDHSMNRYFVLVFSTQSDIPTQVKHEYRLTVNLRDTDRQAQARDLEKSVRAAAEKVGSSEISLWRARHVAGEMTVSIRDNDRGKAKDQLLHLFERAGDDSRDLIKTTARLSVLEAIPMDEIPSAVV